MLACSCIGPADAATGLRDVRAPIVSATVPNQPSPTLPPTPPTTTVIPTPTPRPGREWARVFRVWDGNTVLIDGGLTVRYIGVETPGGGMFNRPLESFGREAAERNVGLVEGKDVEVEQDVNDVDSNGFLLRYVYVGGAMVNEALLREGLAKLAPASADQKYRASLEAAQEAARIAPLNLWTVISPTPRPTNSPTITPTPGPATATATPTPSPVVSAQRTVTLVLTRTSTATPTHVVLTLTPIPRPTPRD